MFLKEKQSRDYIIKIMLNISNIIIYIIFIFCIMLL